MTDITDWLLTGERELARTGRSRWVSLRRHYPLPPAAVWDACTDPRRLGRWLGTPTGELTEGGTVSLHMAETDAGGEEQVATCKIVRCDRPRRLTIDWSWPADPDNAVDLRLLPDGAGTLLVLEHLGVGTAEQAGTYGAGWEGHLHRLDREVRGQDVVLLPWPDVAAAFDPVWRPLIDADAEQSRWPSLRITGDRAEITGEREYPAAPQEVWSAITDPRRLGRWFAEMDGELRLGGRWTATFTGGKASGVVSACVPGERLATSWVWAHDPADMPESRVSVRLHPTETGTRLVLEQVKQVPAIGYTAGWHAYLVGLERHLAGTDPTEPDWNAEFTVAHAVLLRAHAKPVNRENR